LPRRLDWRQRDGVHVGYACVIDENVQASKAWPNLGEEGLHGGLIRDVKLHVRVSIVAQRNRTSRAANDHVSLREVVRYEIGPDTLAGSGNEDSSR
jgi:hypothetical protein